MRHHEIEACDLEDFDPFAGRPEHPFVPDGDDEPRMATIWDDPRSCWT